MGGGGVKVNRNKQGRMLVEIVKEEGGGWGEVPLLVGSIRKRLSLRE